ncbi:multiple cyclophane-containing RiPP AmcA [Hamadaea tsunoensis]|uniref:multiple cyclophane-containing RiPP AmcA n=1 Tax=Hamadaea tsunoensis TaxID=53368 RepID=UPI0004186FA1|nr:multiple cyclophane-containing RiPP AmcA [Hamadaea tsunoensis]
MPHRSTAATAGDLADRVRAEGVAELVGEAEQTWRTRAATPGGPVAGPRPFEDAFPTFYQFSNRPQK